MRRNGKSVQPLGVIRCAVYTRKSTDEGLQQDFNSLDAQREAAEAFIKSQAAEGWVCLPERYDDGGFTGANMERPALKCLLADVEARHIDCILVYKVDRLSRSLMDFARIIDTLDRHQVSFVSVTQQFNTASSMGRLTLNVLLSFAQFEREMISERTRDKMAAARRKGKWVGGSPILGYDVDYANARLVVNEGESKLVRAIFELYLERQSLTATVMELNRRTWPRKRWTGKDGQACGGGEWTKANLLGLLRNRTYIGEVDYRGEVVKGEQPAIMDLKVWTRANTLLRSNRLNGGAKQRNKHGALLRGILTCGSCDCSMTHTYTQKGKRRYRYYVCSRAQKQGWDSCPTKSLPAGEIEAFIVEQIRMIGQDPALVAAAHKEACRLQTKQIDDLTAERERLAREIQHCAADVRRVVGEPNAASRLADLQDRLGQLEARALSVDAEIEALEQERIYEADLETALRMFDPVWDSLTMQERTRLIELLVEGVTYDGVKNTIRIAFRSNGIMTLAEAQAR